MEIVKECKVVTIEELCSKLNVSKATIRRDLKELEQNNKLIRTHGGALAIQDNKVPEPTFKVRKNWDIEEKNRIAEAACKYIKPGEVIILDSGTTTLQLAKKMGSFKNITVVTNDIIIAMELSQNKDIDLIVIGGKLRKDFYTLTGIFTEMVLKNIRVDKCFIGADAIDIEFGLMNYNTEEIPVKKLMLTSSREKYALCDHSKFDAVALANICPMDGVNKIITGTETSTETIEKFKKAGAVFEIV